MNSTTRFARQVVKWATRHAFSRKARCDDAQPSNEGIGVPGIEDG